MLQGEVPMLKEVLVIGKESAGKSELIASLSGQAVYASNFRGSTVACESYRTDGLVLVDTPGIQQWLDSDTMRDVMSRVTDADTVLLVIPAMHLDQDLRDLLPLVQGKRGALAVTFRDKVCEGEHGSLPLLSGTIPSCTIDARDLTSDERRNFTEMLHAPKLLPSAFPVPAPRLPPRSTTSISVWLALILLLVPGVGVVWLANHVAGFADPVVTELLAPMVRRANNPVLSGKYGLLTMGPLLFVWAVPTVIIYALVLGAYKASGLIDVISDSLHPVLRPFGLNGRDLPRILMGFGCNVPAVIGTRSCGASSRHTCISAIAYGSACSYQFGATLGVLNAVGKPNLVLPYLLYLGATTLLYARFVSGAAVRSPLNILLMERRAYLVFPRWRAVWREAAGSIRSFFRTSLPIFFAITVIASVLDSIGALRVAAAFLKPLMALFHLPVEAALGILLACIRKDGLLLLVEVPMSGVQALTALYLGGVLLPCLVTLLTIIRERSWKFAASLAAKQLCAAVGFSLLLATFGRFL